MTTITQVLDLRKESARRFLAPAVPSKIARTFGGQVVGQALRAAQHTVQGKQVHSLHSYFVGPGDSTKEISLDVEVLRDGRSFATRQVRASQDGKLIFVLNASFRIAGEEGPEHQEPAPQVPGPEEAIPGGGGQLHSPRIILKEWEDWDIRLVPEPHRDPDAAEKTGSGFRYIWFRNTSLEDLDDEDIHRSALAYMSDMTLIRSALIAHQGMQVQLASLDHSIWFVRPVRINEWLLYEQVSPSASGGTGLAQGRFYREDGQLVAITTQEGLMRTLKKPLDGSSAHGEWRNV